MEDHVQVGGNVGNNIWFVNIYWRQYFHENLQITLPEGAVVCCSKSAEGEM